MDCLFKYNNTNQRVFYFIRKKGKNNIYKIVLYNTDIKFYKNNNKKKIKRKKTFNKVCNLYKSSKCKDYHYYIV